MLEPLPPATSDDGAAVRRRSPGHSWAVAGLVLAVAVATSLTIAVSRAAPWLVSIDARATAAIRGWADPRGWPVAIADVVGRLTEPLWSGMLVAILVVLLYRARFHAAAQFLAGSALLGVSLTSLTKVVVGRTRPDSAQAHDVHMHVSFPSGHAAAGIYLYLATGVVLLNLGRTNGWAWSRRIGVLLMVVGPLIGVSRLVLGVHWPSDVLAGWAFGATAVLTCALVLWDRLLAGWRRPARAALSADGTGP